MITTNINIPATPVNGAVHFETNSDTYYIFSAINQKWVSEEDLKNPPHSLLVEPDLITTLEIAKNQK